MLQSEELNVKCPGLSLWGEPDIPVTVDSRAGCVRVTARFDDDWQVARRGGVEKRSFAAARERQVILATFGKRAEEIFNYCKT